MKKKFDGNITILGYGAVSQCTLPLLQKHIDIPYKRITLIEFEDKSKQLRPFIKKGLKFYRKKITPDNLGSVMTKYAGSNGFVIDLAWNIGANDIIKWCHDHNNLYINTSVEIWDPNVPKTVYDKTLHWRQMKLREMTKTWPKDSLTTIVDHGANPGLISHFARQALVDITDRLIKDKKISGKDLEELLEYKSKKDFSHLAQKLGIKVIHCSERDTQITNKPKRVNEFVNTWSIPGFHEEGTAPSEIGWGTHEKELPPLAHRPINGPDNQIFLARMGINTWARSWVPEVGEIEGMIVRHGEAFGISDRMTIRDKNGKVIYRPTVHYVYMPCHEALSSLAELRARRYEMQPKLRTMLDDIVSGKDILGAFLMGHAYNSWWTGTSLSIEQARKIIKGQNATTLQVAAGLLAAIEWMIDNPKKGLCSPEDLPHDYVLKVARPYLGNLISEPSDWTPLKNRQIFFPENQTSKPDPDTWQFKNFLALP